MRPLPSPSALRTRRNWRCVAKAQLWEWNQIEGLKAKAERRYKNSSRPWLVMCVAAFSAYVGFPNYYLPVFLLRFRFFCGGGPAFWNEKPSRRAHEERKQFLPNWSYIRQRPGGVEPKIGTRPFPHPRNNPCFQNLGPRKRHHHRSIRAADRFVVRSPHLLPLHRLRNNSLSPNIPRIYWADCRNRERRCSTAHCQDAEKTASPSTRRKSVVSARSRPSLSCDGSRPGHVHKPVRRAPAHRGRTLRWRGRDQCRDCRFRARCVRTPTW